VIENNFYQYATKLAGARAVSSRQMCDIVVEALLANHGSVPVSTVQQNNDLWSIGSFLLQSCTELLAYCAGLLILR